MTWEPDPEYDSHGDLPFEPPRSGFDPGDDRDDDPEDERVEGLEDFLEDEQEEDLEDYLDPERILERLVAARGTPGARDEVDFLIRDSIAETASVIDRLRDLAAEGKLSSEERTFITTELLASVELDIGACHPRYAECLRAIEDYERIHQHDGLVDTSTEWYELEAQWTCVIDRQLSAWFVSRGDREMAAFYMLEPHEQDRLTERGELLLCGEITPPVRWHGDTKGGPPVQRIEGYSDPAG